MMNSMLLFAAGLDDLIRIAAPVIIFLIIGLGPILKGIAEQRVRREREQRRAQQAAARRPAQQGGAPNPEAEVERFLREVARNRGDARKPGPAPVPVEIVLDDESPATVFAQPVKKQQVPGRPTRKQPTRPKSQPGQRTSTVTDEVELRHLQGTLHDRPEQHSQLEQTDEEMAEHVHSVFDHRLGQLGASTSELATPVSESSRQTTERAVSIDEGIAVPASAAGVTNLLRDPATVRQAILIHEILGTPRCDRPDVG